MQPRIRHLIRACLVLLATATGSAMASSHREAPFITTSPKVDGTDFYMFRSYEGIAANGSGGRSDYVTLLANYQPLQGPYGGPNYFSMDPNALYEIHIDNNGDAREDLTFQFRFQNTLKSIPLTIGGVSVPIPLIQAGAVSAPNAAAGNEPVIGGWTTASLRQARLLNGKPGAGNNQAEKAGGAWTQVSRLGNPLVNEVVIGLPDKDKFNASSPKDDTQFLTYVTNPTLPALLGVVLGANIAPINFPRTDLAATFLTGITGINKPATNPTPSEMLRLNTAIAPVPFASQNRLGVAGNALAGGTDNAGFPNGRRPKDDVVDIALVAMLGGLCVINGDTDALKLNSVPGVPSLTSACKGSSVPLGATSANIHDAVDQATVPFLPVFPYLNTPNPGSM